MSRWDWRNVVTLSVALGGSAALVWYFHDRFWWAVDEGIYAYVAQRVNAGDVLHRDIIALHAGYINLVNALALRIFGEDLLSLRYPLAGLTIVQALLATLLLIPKGVWSASAAALVVTAFSFIQFLNPSANWYALFLFFVTVWLLTRVDTTRAPGAILIGFLIGLCFLFRQLSGVFLAMGVLTWLLVTRQPSGDGRSLLARSLMVIMALGLCGYLWSKGSLAGLLLFGIWPLAFLLVTLRQVRIDDIAVAKLILRLAAGASLAAAPLIVYHLVEGSFGAWLHEITLAAIVFYYEQEFISQTSFILLAIGGLLGVSSWNEPGVFLNGLFWLSLLAAPALLGGLTLRDTIQKNAATVSHPLPITALFFTLVALQYQIPIYLFFGISPVLLALLLFGSHRHTRATASVLLLLGTVGVIYQAGQPVSRGMLGTVRGERVALDATEGLPLARLKMERVDQEIYRKVIDRIEADAGPHEALFTLPMDPEFNFLTQRPSPVRYFGTSIGLRRDEDVTDTMERLVKAAPIFVIHRREDKYFTPLSRDLLARIRQLDPVPESLGPFDLYRLPAQPAPGATPIVRE